jgi:threonine/homoserine/homoserine lactone efflux protein
MRGDRDLPSRPHVMLAKAIRRSPRFMRAIDYLFAGLMGAFAVRLVFARAD